jgi:glycosyltransferase involved in cell wall biosynthesis
MTERVSVILIVRNGAAFIAEALDSVQLQSRQPDEVLVIDGQSTDDTVRIARGFAGVRVLPQTSTGVANAYNEGIAQAKGSLLAFISHDDRWLPGKLESQLSFLAAHPETMMSLTHVQHVLHEGVAPPPGFRAELLDHPVPGLIMETLLVRRESFDRVGLFDPAFAVSEDTDWFARAKDMGLSMHVLPETLVIKRVHDRNSSLVFPHINGLLLRALRGSIARKRAAKSED